MSYEGYEQVLCENGHDWEEDAMENMYGDGPAKYCKDCEGRVVWRNCVDTTNDDGSQYRKGDYRTFVGLKYVPNFVYEEEEDVQLSFDQDYQKPPPQVRGLRKRRRRGAG